MLAGRGVIVGEGVMEGRLVADREGIIVVVAGRAVGTVAGVLVSVGETRVARIVLVGVNGLSTGVVVELHATTNRLRRRLSGNTRYLKFVSIARNYKRWDCRSSVKARVWMSFNNGNFS